MGREEFLGRLKFRIRWAPKLGLWGLWSWKMDRNDFMGCQKDE